MQKLGLLVGNFLFSFVWYAPFGPRRLFEVTEVVMSFSQKRRHRLGIWIQKKMFKVLFFFIFDVVQYSLLKFLAHYLLGNFSIFPKGGRSSSTEVPGTADLCG